MLDANHKCQNNKTLCSGVWLRWWAGHNPQSFHWLPRPPESTWQENTVTIAWDKLLTLSESQFPLLGNEGKLESSTPNSQSSSLSGLNCLGSKSSNGVHLVLSWSWNVLRGITSCQCWVGLAKPEMRARGGKCQEDPGRLPTSWS